MLNATWHDNRPGLFVVVPIGTARAAALRTASGIAAREGYGGVTVIDESFFHAHEPDCDMLLVGAADNLAARGHALQFNGKVLVSDRLTGGAKLREVE